MSQMRKDWSKEAVEQFKCHNDELLEDAKDKPHIKGIISREVKASKNRASKFVNASLDGEIQFNSIEFRKDLNHIMEYEEAKIRKRWFDRILKPISIRPLYCKIYDDKVSYHRCFYFWRKEVIWDLKKALASIPNWISLELAESIDPNKRMVQRQCYPMPDQTKHQELMRFIKYWIAFHVEELSKHLKVTINGKKLKDKDLADYVISSGANLFEIVKEMSTNKLVKIVHYIGDHEVVAEFRLGGKDGRNFDGSEIDLYPENLKSLQFNDMADKITKEKIFDFVEKSPK